MSEIKIERFEQLTGTPALQLAMDGTHVLRVHGWADESCTGVGWNWKALLARVDGKPVGVLTYEEQEWRKAFFINVGYVHRDYRRQGVYRALWNELLVVLGEKKFQRVCGVVSVDNKEMQAVMECFGRKLDTLGYEYRLDEGQDG